MLKKKIYNYKTGKTYYIANKIDNKLFKNQDNCEFYEAVQLTNPKIDGLTIHICYVDNNKKYKEKTFDNVVKIMMTTNNDTKNVFPKNYTEFKINSSKLILLLENKKTVEFNGNEIFSYTVIKNK